MEKIYELKSTNKYLKDIYFAFIIITVVFNSGYVISTISGEIELLFLVPASISIFLISIFKKRYISRKFNLPLTIFVLLLFGCIFSFISNADIQNLRSYIRLPLILILAFNIHRLYSFENFIYLFIKIMKILSIISLISYFLFYFLKLPIPLQIVTNINNTSYFNGYLFFILKHDFSRNTGLFWEPGLFSSFLIFALIFEISFKKELSKFNILLFTITILSTNSTAGYFLLPIVFMLLLKYRKSNQIIIVLYYFLLIIFILLYLNYMQILEILYTLNPLLFGKIIQQSGSYLTRVNAPILDIEIFSMSPLFGVGFRNYNELFRELSFQSMIISQTSTLTYFVATLGIFGLFYFFGFLYGILKLNKSIFERIVVLILFLFILTKEPHQHNLTTFIIFFYLLRNSQIKTINMYRKVTLNEYNKQIIFRF